MTRGQLEKRIQRAIEQPFTITKAGDSSYNVKNRESGGSYLVEVKGSKAHKCTCPDFSDRIEGQTHEVSRALCKHMIRIETMLKANKEVEEAKKNGHKKISDLLEPIENLGANDRSPKKCEIPKPGERIECCPMCGSEKFGLDRVYIGGHGYFTGIFCHDPGCKELTVLR